MELLNTNGLFLAMMLLQGAKALDCALNTMDTLKVTIKTLPEEYHFDDYEQYEMKATIAYSVQKYCGESESPADDCKAGTVATIASDVTLYNITERISMCVEVDNFASNVVRQAIKNSKANLNGALILTDEELYVDGILPTLSPVPKYDFEPWLIAYIVVFCLVIIGGVTVLLYSKFHKSGESEDKERILDVEEGSVEDLSGNTNTNNAYEQVENIAPSSKLVEEKANYGDQDEEYAVPTDQKAEEATAL